MSGAKSEKHESVAALMEEAKNGESAKDVIRRKARQIISDHSEYWKGPPFCPLLLADLQGIRVREAPFEISSDGRIFPDGKDVYIEYAAGQTDQRIRFTIFHELAHTLFPDCYERVRLRSKAERAQREFEDLCNLGASEFLFPKEEFESLMGSSIPTAKRIDGLSKSFDASIDATVWRIVDLAKSPVCAVFARHVPSEKGRKSTLKVKYSISSEGFPTQIHPNYWINTKSKANEAWQKNEFVSGYGENWRVRNSWYRFRTESLRLLDIPGVDVPDIVVILQPC